MNATDLRRVAKAASGGQVGRALRRVAAACERAASDGHCRVALDFDSSWLPYELRVAVRESLEKDGFTYYDGDQRDPVSQIQVSW